MENKYFEILNKICEEKIDITKLYILSCMCMENDQTDWKAMEYTYECWLQADTDLDLARLSAIVCNRWEEIQSGEVAKQEIIDDCLCV